MHDCPSTLRMGDKSYPWESLSSSLHGVFVRVMLAVAAFARTLAGNPTSSTLNKPHNTVLSYSGTIVERTWTQASGWGSSSASPIQAKVAMGRWKEQTSPYEILSDDEDADHEDHADIVRKIIANEMDMDIADVADDLNLTSLGMDSFASCRVLTALREVTKAEVSPVLLMECSTVLEIETALGLQRDDESPSPRSLLTISSSGPLTPLGWSPLAQDGCGYFFDDALTLKQQPPPQLEPPATSVLLQGSPKRATKTLFLFPDGSGSAYSYARLAPLDPSVAVYGLNCPYRTTPEGWVTGIPGVSRLYLEEIRRRQPKGPYYLGGWSAGGIVAYEITQQLMARGESVEQIILIDSPCPVSLEPLPEYLHQFLDDIGLLGTGGIGTSPTWLIPHFRKAIKALDEYQPVPMRPGTAPKVVAIWAGEGVCNGRGAPARPKEYLQSPGPAKWLLDGRTDFGDNGWGQLFPAADMVFATTAGNHFTMMAGDNATALADILRRHML